MTFGWIAITYIQRALMLSGYAVTDSGHVFRTSWMVMDDEEG